MIKTQDIDTELLDNAIEKSGLKSGFIAETLGISRQAFNNKRKGKTQFRKSEVYVMRDLLKISVDESNRIFFP